MPLAEYLERVRDSEIYVVSVVSDGLIGHEAEERTSRETP